MVCHASTTGDSLVWRCSWCHCSAATRWTFVTLGTNITDTVVTRREAFLVTNGPYRWVRHPFYLAFGLGVTADTLATANWFLGITGLITFAVIVLRTKREEENLIARFGDEYRSYMTRSGRFLPFA
jgi:protein-S-isoprenylcysteine O-methyltransferase Ste14